MLLALFLMLLAPASYAGEIKDDAKFFSRDGLNKSKELINKIKTETGKDVVVETYDGIPKNLRESFQKNRDKFYINWVEERARELNLDGVLVLIAREKAEDVAVGKSPSSRVEVTAGKKFQQAGFTNAYQKEITDFFIDRFKKSKFDEGLYEGLSVVDDKVKKTLGIGAKIKDVAKKSGEVLKETGQDAIEGKLTMSTIILYAVLAMIGLWLVFGILRAFGGQRRQMANQGYQQQQQGFPQQPQVNSQGMPLPPARRGPFDSPYQQQGYPQQQPMGYPPQQRGGGMMGPILGGLFGAAAGSWMYDKFMRPSGGGGFGGGSPGSSGGDFGGGGGSQPRGDSEYYTTGGDFGGGDSQASSGGNFDDGVANSGGGDFGGGNDFGSTGGSGGDFGGGDFGGGSDFGTSEDTGGGFGESTSDSDL